ncbi:hypothetical protein OG21DRAFT_1421097 [Imleria badia]|nr:hypothetical protein OG21DRAFT_1421097 [Imleria badia]
MFEAFGVSSPFDPTFHYVTSPIFSPVLDALRLLFAVYTFTTTTVTLALSQDPDSYLSYFTDLTYIGLVAYFCASGIQAVALVLLDRESYPLQTWPRVLQLLHVLLHSTIIVLPIIVTAVFWSLLASSATFETPYSTWTNVSQHVMNTTFVLFEILFTHSGPSSWTHLIPLLLILACYLGVAYITRCVVLSLVKDVCLLRWRVSLRYGRFEDHSESGAEALEEWQELAAPKDVLASEARRSLLARMPRCHLTRSFFVLYRLAERVSQRS